METFIFSSEKTYSYKIILVQLLKLLNINNNILLNIRTIEIIIEDFKMMFCCSKFL